MPRRERTVARNRSMVAAARSYSTRPKADSAKEDKLRGGEEWQRAAWQFFDLIGEYRQAPTIMGALLSRAKLVVLENGAPTKNETAKAALAELFGGEDGHAEMLRQFGVHFTVAGEGWLISPPLTEMKGASPDDWQVAAATQVKKRGSELRVNGKKLEGERMAIRVWRPHPADKEKADAPTRAVLPTLSELLQLRKRIAAQIDSRLFGAGLLMLPAETEFPSQPVQQLNPGDPTVRSETLAPGDAQGLADLLLQVARIAVQNPESAEAMIPIIALADGENIGNSKHITFWSELDKMAPKLREELLTSVARGMDIPVEVLLGSSGSNHWNAWLSDENNVKIHGEPTLKIITTGITTKYLQVALEGEEGIDDPLIFTVGVDTSQMRLRPNRGKEALELNDRMILSDEAAIRENGFIETDLMTEEGLRVAVLRKMAQGSTTPELVALAAGLLGVEMPVLQDEREPAEARPTPSLKDHPVRELPERAPAASGLAMAAEQMVDRALQRAGNRLKTKLGLKEPPCAANRLYQVTGARVGDLDDLLAGAWDSCGTVADLVDPVELARALDIYTRSIMMNGKEPSRAGIATAMELLIRQQAA